MGVCRKVGLKPILVCEFCTTGLALAISMSPGDLMQ